MRNPREYLEMKAIYVLRPDGRTSLLLGNIRQAIKIINYFESHVTFTFKSKCKCRNLLHFLERIFLYKLDKISHIIPRSFKYYIILIYNHQYIFHFKKTNRLYVYKIETASIELLEAEKRWSKHKFNIGLSPQLWSRFPPYSRNLLSQAYFITLVDP